MVAPPSLMATPGCRQRATTPESAYESITVWVAEMPISSPASRSAETASNALPSSVCRLNTSIAPMIAKTPMATRARPE